MEFPNADFSPRLEASHSAGHSGASPNEASEEVPLLIFRLQDSLFAVWALAVREILPLPALSPLAETAPFIVGVLNLRGNIVPVMDLNARLGRPSPPPRLQDALIVLQWNDALVAILADEVRAVNPVSSAQIEAPPAVGRSSDGAAPFIAGVLRSSEGIVMLLHLSHLLGFDAVPDRVSLHDAPSAVAATPRFELQNWTPEERAVLQARANRLRSAFDSNVDADADTNPNALSEDVSGIQSTKNEGAFTEDRAPVAVVALGGEEFGVALEKVREFASVSAITSVPCCPPHILGQINLRGEIVTLIDARQTLRTAQQTPPFFAATISGSSAPVAPRAHPVVVVSHGEGAVGIVVDDVRDVLYQGGEIAREAASDAPVSGYFAGSTLYQGRLLPLLDVARLLEEGHLDVEDAA